MKHVIVPLGGAYRTHTPVPDVDDYNLPDNAEIYDDKTEFKKRLNELS